MFLNTKKAKKIKTINFKHISLCQRKCVFMNKFLTRNFFSAYVGMVSGQLPLKENYLPVRVGVWVKSWRQPDNCPQGKLPPS